MTEVLPRPSRMWWPTDDSVEWLSQTDVRLALAALRIGPGAASGRPPSLLEIGVWKAGWTASMLANEPLAHLVGIDPYPGFDQIRTRTLAWTEHLGLADRFTLHAGWDELDEQTSFDLVHVDGEHSEEAALRDLALAAARLRPGGLIVVDDYRHVEFPGVASALFRFCEAERFRVILTTESKAYIAEAAHAGAWFDAFTGLLSSDEWLVWSRHGSGPMAYEPPPRVLGQEVLLCSGMRPDPESMSRRRRVARAILPRPVRQYLAGLLRRIIG